MFRSAALLALGLLLAAPALAGPATFSDIVHKRFDQWDADHNGLLMPDEVDRLTIDPSWKGEDAAAIATIKLAMRSKKDPIPSLTLADIDKTSIRTLDQDDELSAITASGVKARDTLQLRFERASKQIRAVKHDLFLDPTPDLDKFRQGRIGDCFFVSVVGAMVERDPLSVKNMIKPEVDGGYTVTFSNFKPITIPPLTEVEFALVSTTGDEGLWLPVLEKAYGTLRMSARPAESRPLSGTDAIARGGNVATSIQSLTGHAVSRTNLGPDKNPAAARTPEIFLDTLREQLTAATNDKRLMGAGTDANPNVPGINPTHAYAIFSYNPKTDTLRMWNPHGNTFRPKGKAGIQFGYPTRAGRFEVPLTDFIKTFRTLAIETSKPYDNTAPRSPRRTIAQPTFPTSPAPK